LTQLRPYLRNGTPIVGLELSCLAVFKDELTKVLPHDDDASRLCRQAYHFAEFFDAFDIPVPSLKAKAVLWGHCHHRATGGIEPEEKLLSRMGVETTKAQGGCCGLAGSWGFENGKWQISMDCGEEGLFPAVRNADRTTLVVADGFSCKTQLQHAQGAKRGIDREALHVGQVLALARTGRPGAKPKPRVLRRLARTLGPLAIGTAAIAAGVRRLVLR
jgi:Fe-S oxidoreductase